MGVEQIRPDVHYDPKFFGNRLPYTVSVDEVGMGQVLKDIGLTDAEVSKQVVNITVKGRAYSLLKLFGYSELGSYSPLTREISIYTYPIWEFYFLRRKKIAERIAKNGHNERVNPFGEALFTKRLAPYLQSLPESEKERGLRFADKILLNVANRTLRDVLPHEVKHKIDDNTQNNDNPFPQSHAMTVASRAFLLGLFSPLAIQIASSSENNGLWLPIGLAAGIVGGATGYVVGYITSPEEKDAREFQQDFTHLNHTPYIKITSRT